MKIERFEPDGSNMLAIHHFCGSILLTAEEEQQLREYFTPAMPVIPEGWRCGHITPNGDEWTAFLLGVAPGPYQRYHVKGEGPDPVAALTAAIAQAKEVDP